jgi:hypothetical protein
LTSGVLLIGLRRIFLLTDVAREGFDVIRLDYGKGTDDFLDEGISIYIITLLIRVEDGDASESHRATAPHHPLASERMNSGAQSLLHGFFPGASAPTPEPGGEDSFLVV